MKVLINYADKRFYQSQKENSRTAISAGGFDSSVSYERRSLEQKYPQVYEEYSEILNAERGAGYWAWKPLLIKHQFELWHRGVYKDDDIVMYSDSGATFAKNLQPLFDKIEKEPMGIAAFRLAGLHYECQYNRKKVVEAFGLNPHDIGRTPQHMASFVLFRMCSSAEKIVDFWLSKCLTPELIMDQPRDPDEYTNFVDHRHDQALWSLTVKKFGVPVYPDPTQWGLQHGESAVKDFYIQHHRSKD
jgi:hypothetical protein